MRREPIQIKCPCCDSILVIDPFEKKVLEIRKPIVEESTGDRLQDAFLKVQKRKSEAEEQFKKAKEKDKERKSKMDEIFRESLEKAKDEDDGTPPSNPFDW